MHEIARTQRQGPVIGGAEQIHRRVAGLEDDGAGNDLARVPHEEQFGPQRRGIDPHQRRNGIVGRVIGEILAVRHRLIERVELIGALDAGMLERQARLFRFVEVVAPFLVEALALRLIAQPQVDDVAAREQQRRALLKAARHQLLVLPVLR